jgi:predicted RNase H-like nuclease (RuvC/YqgF family)
MKDQLMGEQEETLAGFDTERADFRKRSTHIDTQLYRHTHIHTYIHTYIQYTHSHTYIHILSFSIGELQEEAERLNSTLEQERVERESEREVLQEQVDDLSSQLYEAHKEIESLVDNFRSQMTTSAFKQRVDQGTIAKNNTHSHIHTYTHT